MAEDDLDDRELFIEGIAELGLTLDVHFAEDGSSFQHELASRGKSVSMIFLDLRIPRASGVECLRAIRADAKYSDIPVMILATSSRSEDVDITYQLGANKYYQKPSTFSDLKAIIHDAVSIDWSSCALSRADFLSA